MVSWLRDAVFYEIYPQSFMDSNGDGIGDLAGITEKLDYIRDLGCNALWINPCFDSPFKDAGYDVRDYKRVATRYGTNEDLYRLFEQAHMRGIHVLLDLVPGHTSEEHEWFLESGKAEPNAYSGRYIWTDYWIAGIQGHPYIAGERERNGAYMLNFFKCQPALNYGFLHPKEKWQKAMDDPDSLLCSVRRILKLRAQEKDLQADGDFEVLLGQKGQPYIYRRGSLICISNPSGRTITVEDLAFREILFCIGDIHKNSCCDMVTEAAAGPLVVGPGSFAVLRTEIQ